MLFCFVSYLKRATPPYRFVFYSCRGVQFRRLGPSERLEMSSENFGKVRDCVGRVSMCARQFNGSRAPIY